MLRTFLVRVLLPVAFAAAVVALLALPLIEYLTTRWLHPGGDRTATHTFLTLFVGVSALAFALLAAGAVWLVLRRWTTLLVADIRGKRFSGDALSPAASLPILSQVREALEHAEQSQRL